MDYCGHGTHVAGIVSAETNNGEGIAGISWKSKILVIQVLDDYGNGTWAALAKGILWAIKYGARVINYSAGDEDEPGKSVKSAIETAEDNNVILVCSVGNDWLGPVEYPAKYSTSYSNVIAVSATDPDDFFALYSNKGPEVNVAAPGGIGGYMDGNTIRYNGPLNRGMNIYSTTPNYPFHGQYDPDYPDDPYDTDVTQNYGYYYGTSMAAAHVTGIAALILSKYPDLSASIVRTIIEQSADDVNYDIYPGKDDYLGYGRVNAFKALAYADAYVNGHIVPDDFTTIQDAIDDAVSGQFVFVKAGTYNESVQMKNGVSLIGAGGAGRDISTIQIGGYYPAVSFSHIGNGTRLMGFTLKGYVGVYLYYSVHPEAPTDPPIITENNLKDSNEGIRCCYYSKSIIQGNNIFSNNFGVWAYYSSDPVMYGDSEPNNRIEGNINEGIHASRASEPKLGRLGVYGPGNNRLVNPAYDLHATSDCNLIYAEWNWWGEDPPNSSQIYHEGGPQGIDYIPWDTTGFTKPVVAPLYAGEPPEAIEHLRRGDLYVELGRYQEALRELKYVLENYPESRLVPFATDLLVKAYGYLGKSGEALNYLEGISRTYSGTLLERTALEFTIPILVWRGDYQRAVSRAQDLRRAFPTTEMAKHLLFELGMIYKHELGDQEKAREAFQSFISQYPRDELVALATMELNTMDLAKPRKESLAEAAQTSFALLQNYPNPANPTTRITFTLPQKAHVTLEIYNLLGQRVRTLVEGAREAGSYSIVWDGRDERGRVVSSGVYFYRLRAGELVRASKMLLLR